MSRRRVVLTGRGIVSPLGVGVDAHWQALLSGRGAVAPVPRLQALGLSASRGGTVAADVIQPHLGRLPRKQQKLYNRATLFAMLASSLAMEEAKLTTGAGEPTRFGVLLGVNALCWDLQAMTEYLIASESRTAAGTLDVGLANAFCMRNINPLDYSLKTLPNLAAGHVAIAHDAQGLCRALTEGPVGGTHAIGQGYRLIEDGDLDVALCGGADAGLEELLFAAYAGAGLLASDDGVRAGSCAGEGSGVAVLEEAERARQRGAPVLGEVLGFAAASGEHDLVPAIEPARLARRLARVVADVVTEAGAAPDVVSLHADGTPSAAAAETTAIGGLAHDGAALLRMKRAHGELGAASGPIEFLACSAVIERAMIPPVVSSNSGTLPREVDRALVISLGLFGECVAVMLGSPRVRASNAD